MITNISIVSVFVKDVDESKSFYTEILGFQPQDDITLGRATGGAPSSTPTSPSSWSTSACRGRRSLPTWSRR